MSWVPQNTPADPAPTCLRHSVQISCLWRLWEHKSVGSAGLELLPGIIRLPSGARVKSPASWPLAALGQPWGARNQWSWPH